MESNAHLSQSNPTDDKDGTRGEWPVPPTFFFDLDLTFRPPPFSLSTPTTPSTSGALFGAAATAAHYNDVDLLAGLRTILQLLLLPRSSGGGDGSGGKYSSSSSSSSSADVERLARLVERLALDVAAKTAGGAGVTIVNGGSSSKNQGDSATTTTLAAAVALVLLCLARPSLPPAAALRRLRAALGSLLPATRAALDAAVASLSDSVDSLGCKLAAARAHLSRRVDGVDAAVESLAKQAAETSRLVEGVAKSVEGVDVGVNALKGDIGSAKEGVALLCRVVADLIRGGNGNNSNNDGTSRRQRQSRAAAAALVAELDAFAREASKGLPSGAPRRRVPGVEVAIEKEFEEEALLFDFVRGGSGSSGSTSASGNATSDDSGGVDSCSSSSSIGSTNSGGVGMFLCRRSTGSAAGLAGDCLK